MTLITTIPLAGWNVLEYGALGNGTQDDTSYIQSVITAHGGDMVALPKGTYKISAPLTMSVANTRLIGIGAGTIIQPSASFSGAEIISITADKCEVRDLQIMYANTTSSGNPVANGIEVSAARYATLKNLRFYYLNGWAVESIGGASVNNVGCFVDEIHMEHCATGIHLQGVSGSNYVGQMFLSNIHAEVIDNGDAFFCEDINDIELVNFNGAVAGASTSGSMIHIKGNSASHFYSNIDVGAIAQSTVSPSILIETSANGSPSNITMTGGVVQKGSIGASITDGSNIIFKGITFKFANTHGVQVSGATVATPIIFEDCVFQTNNQSNGTSYDVNLTHSTGFSYIKQCHLQSPVGSGAGLVTNPANDASHRCYFLNTHFAGSGTTPSNCFATTPQIVRGCPGYNPRGSITPTTIGASPFTGNSSQNDISIIFTAINTMTAFSINGTSIGGVPVAFVPYRVPARSPFIITYSGAAPTYLWFAD
jgi:hypothetical protein